MNPIPLVSVVIPCYRQGRYLTESVNAALTQTHPRIEVVVVNDGSDDNTDEVARSFGSRIVYVSQANAGHCAARNAGLRHASGEYLFYLDADDLIHPQAIAELTAAAAAGGTAIMGYHTFATFGDWLGGENAPAGDSLFPWILTRNYPLHCFLVPTALARSVGGFDPKIVSHEDHEFWLRIASADQRLRSIPLRGAYYRQHPFSESRQSLRMARGQVQLLERTTGYLEANPDIAKGYGSTFLRHLYVSRLTLAAQAPELDRTPLDRCIVRLHRAGVRSPKPWLDWIYAVVPPPLRSVVDQAIVALFVLARSKKLGVTALGAR